jgi:hypothetical protein
VGSKPEIEMLDGSNVEDERRARKTSKFPLIAVSKMYPERLEINDCATNRKCKRSSLDFVKVGKRKVECIRCVDIRNNDLSAFSTGQDKVILKDVKRRIVRLTPK